ncbi:hypothetical protein [Sphingomonas sp. URHD0057]|uniref:hypothetical protein n=1 Tax=Sphingomonas sp. URHD0057 TaxID=1380389 RepID=UPI0012DC19FD|nr:hypothetical protein [Sphingomonas sp. URHD0057]
MNNAGQKELKAAGEVTGRALHFGRETGFLICSLQIIFGPSVERQGAHDINAWRNASIAPHWSLLFLIFNDWK